MVGAGDVLLHQPVPRGKLREHCPLPGFPPAGGHRVELPAPLAHRARAHVLDSRGLHPHLTLHPTPYTLHHTPYTLHPTRYTLHPAPYTLHPTPPTLNPQLSGGAARCGPGAVPPYPLACICPCLSRHCVYFSLPFLTLLLFFLAFLDIQGASGR